jgi:predicted phosphoribosyltransferase
MSVVFADRQDAGRQLAARLVDLAGEDAVVLGLPRGGIPVAAEVASKLAAPLDVLVVGKVGVPGHEELALAAVADDGRVALNPSVIAATGLSDDEVGKLARRHAAELAQRGLELRGGREPEPLGGRTVIVVDDGMATGATMRVALDVVRRRSPRTVVAAVPVASPEASSAVAAVADRLVCVATPPGFRAVGPWYGDFTQVTDGQVRALLSGSSREAPGQGAPGPDAPA